MRILFTICGRAGSKGIKNKNLRSFCGKPLVYYTIAVIDLYKRYHQDITCDVVTNSDSTELLNLVINNGMIEIEEIMRNADLAGDSIGKVAVIKDCLITMEERKGVQYNMVIDLDITSPLRTLDDLEKVIQLHTKTNADVTTTVAAARRNPYFNQVKRTKQGVKKIIDSDFTARQQAPEIFDMNASIYAYRTEFLRLGKGVLDGYCEIVEMYDTGILDLDHENDFELMEVIATHLFNKQGKFRQLYENVPALDKRN